MESQDTVDLQTVGDRASDRNPKREQERPPVGKSLGLSVVNTTKADSHFVFICWLIMMKNEQGNRREGLGMRRNADHLLSEDSVRGRAWMDTSTPFVKYKIPAVSQMGSAIRSHLVLYVWPLLFYFLEGFLHLLYVLLHGKLQ